MKIINVVASHERLIQSIDADCLLIYQALMSLSSSQKLTGADMNPIALSFHELMMFITSVIIRRAELKEGVARPDLVGQMCAARPFVDYTNAFDFVGVSQRISDWSKSLKDNSIRHKTLKSTLVSAFGAIYGKLGRKKVVGISGSVILDKKFLYDLLTSGFSVKLVKPVPTHFNTFCEFKNLLAETVEFITQNCQFLCAADYHFLMSILPQLVESSSVIDVKSSLGVDVLVVGTNSNLFTRALSAGTQNSGIPVISILHGEADGLLDEPIFGYGERTFSDYAVSYGTNHMKGDYQFMTAPGGCNMPLIIPSNSDLVRRLYTESDIPAIRDIECTFVYVPTSYSRFNTYGPFRALNDVHYASFRRLLASSFNRLFVKCHPKGDRDFDDGVPDSRRLLGSLADAISIADVLVFDYVSTAFIEASASTKPIIYFDLGIRNLSAMGQDFIDKRCIRVKVKDFCEPNLKEMVIGANGTRSNNGIFDFCLLAEAKSRSESVVELIQSILE